MSYSSITFQEPAVQRGVFTSLTFRVKQWVDDIFGNDTATSVEERVLRFLEEAIEVAQAAGITPAKVRQVRDYVYSRPVGAVDQEIAGSFVTLFALAGYVGVDAGAVTLAELERIETPEMVEKMRAKQAFKRSHGLTHDAADEARPTLEQLREVEDYSMTRLNTSHPGHGTVTGGRLWGHVKSGGLYHIDNVVTEEETGQPMVLYRPVSNGKDTKMPTFARPLSSFLEEVELARGVSKIKRFVPVMSQSVLVASHADGEKFPFPRLSEDSDEASVQRVAVTL